MASDRSPYLVDAVKASASRFKETKNALDARQKELDTRQAELDAQRADMERNAARLNAEREEFQRELGKLKVGQVADLVVVSGGRSHPVKVTLARARDLKDGNGFSYHFGDGTGFGNGMGFGGAMVAPRIMKFDKNGKFIKTFGHLGSRDGELKGPHVLAFDSAGRLFVADRSNSRVAIFDQDGKFIGAWKQFGRPSGIFIDKNDMLYVSDSESEEAPGKDTNNPGCKRGIRGGSVKDGKVQFYVPPPPVSDPKLPPPEGVAVDSHGTIYAAAVPAKEVYKYVKK